MDAEPRAPGAAPLPAHSHPLAYRTADWAAGLAGTVAAVLGVVSLLRDAHILHADEPASVPCVLAASGIIIAAAGLFFALFERRRSIRVAAGLLAAAALASVLAVLVDLFTSDSTLGHHDALPTALALGIAWVALNWLGSARTRPGRAGVAGLALLATGVIGALVLGFEASGTEPDAMAIRAIENETPINALALLCLGAGFAAHGLIRSSWVAGSVGNKVALAMGALVMLLVTWSATSFVLGTRVQAASARILHVAQPAEVIINELAAALARLNGDLYKHMLGVPGAADDFAVATDLFRQKLRALATLDPAYSGDINVLAARLRALETSAEASILKAYSPTSALVASDTVARLSSQTREALLARVRGVGLGVTSLGDAGAPRLAGETYDDMRQRLFQAVEGMFIELGAHLRADRQAQRRFTHYADSFAGTLDELERLDGRARAPLRRALEWLVYEAGWLFAEYDPHARDLGIEAALRLERELHAPIVHRLARLRARVLDRSAAAFSAQERHAYLAQMGLIGVSALAVALALTIVFVTFGHLVRPIRDLRAQMLALSGNQTDVAIAHQDRSDEVGEMARAVEVFKRNAVERGRAELDRARAEQMLRDTLTHLPSGVMMADRDNVVQLWNERFFELYDMDVHDRDGELRLPDLLYERALRGDYGPGDARELAEERLALTRADELARIEEVRVGQRHLQVARSQLPDGALISLATDITARKNSEEVLQAQSALLGLLHELAADANTAETVEEALGDCLSRLLHYLNAAVAHAWLVDEDTGDLVSSQCWATDGRRDYGAFQRETLAMDQRIWRGLPGICIHKRNPRWVGRETWDNAGPRIRVIKRLGIESAFALPILSGNEPIGALEFFSYRHRVPDRALMQAAEQIGTQLGRVFERERARHALVRALAAAEAASAAKASFLATMSHEIRTPMNGIVGMAELLELNLRDPEHKAMLTTIHESGQALLTIINDILDFSKIEANKLELEAVEFSVGECAESTLAALAPTAAGRNMTLVSNIDPELHAALIGDPVRMRQILLNLCSNAVKFSFAGTSVVVRASVVESDADSLAFELRVIDHGIGIAEDAREALFEPFVQAEASTTRHYGGTGLGLSICQRLVTLMDGTIGVDSRIGEGSQFWVRLRLPRVTGARAPALPSLKGLTVAVASRRGAQLEACDHILGEAGATVVKAANLNEALATSANVIVDADAEDGDRTVDDNTLGERPLVCVQSATGGDTHPGYQGCVTVSANPVRRIALVEAVARALGRLDGSRPRKATRRKRAPDPAVEPRAAAGTVVLVAEDNPVNQEVIRRQLHLLGYACEVVGDGEAALAHWRESHHALVLTDCHMPVMDGFELTRRIRAEQNGQPVAIVAVTANAMAGEAERCLACGMDDYLSKPVALEALERTLARWQADARPSADIEPPSPPGRSDSPFAIVARADMEAMLLAGDTGRAEALMQAAEHLEFAAREAGAHALAALCTELRDAAMTSDWRRLSGSLASLPDRLAELEAVTEGRQTA